MRASSRNDGTAPGVKHAVAFFALAALAASPVASEAQGYPNRPLRIILPYTPGGPTDILTRTVAQKLTETWGQPVVVENRPGAAGMAGTAIAAKGPADGYTLCTAGISFVTSPTLDPKLSFNPMRAFAAVALMGSVANIMVVHPSLPAKSVKELIALGRSRPNEILYASGGSGGTQHLSGELFKHLTGLKLEHVPYRGSAPGLAALLAGEVALGFADMMITLPHVRAGKLRALAVTSEKRSPIVPELPTVAEAALPGYSVVAWFGLVAPAGTPREIVGKLNAEIVRSLQLPDTRQRLTAMGAEPSSFTPEQYGEFLARESDKWARVIKAAGIRAN